MRSLFWYFEQIPAILFIDLERHPEFSVEMDPKQLMSQMQGDKSNLLGGLPGIAETKNDDSAKSPNKNSNNNNDDDEKMVASLIPVTDIRVGLNTASTKGPGTAPPSTAATTARGSRGGTKGSSRGGGRGSPSRASDAGTDMADEEQVVSKKKATQEQCRCNRV